MPWNSATSVPGLDREMKIGEFGRRRAARIDDDDLQRGIALLRRLDPAKQDRMRPRGVRSRDEDEIGMIDVLVARGRGVRAERRLVPVTALDMHSRELVSMLLVPTRPLASLLKT